MCVIPGARRRECPRSVQLGAPMEACYNRGLALLHPISTLGAAVHQNPVLLRAGAKPGVIHKEYPCVITKSFC